MKVYNNTIWRKDAEGPGLRGGMDEWKIAHIDVANNLVRGTNMLIGDVRLRNNLFFGDPTIEVVDSLSGDLRLASFSERVVNKGTPLPEVVDDFDRKPRGPALDIGASQFHEGS